MRLFLLSLALIVGLALPASAENPPAPSDAAHDIDKLYARLARTHFPDEAAGILGEIEHLRLQSGSDAADLLLDRARQARAGADVGLALQLLDAIVDTDPDWSAAWSERANTRFQSGDLPGAMADIAQTLKREPRDIGALSGLAALMLDAGDPDASLKVFDRALKIAPAFAPLKEARARAQTEHLRRSP